MATALSILVTGGAGYIRIAYRGRALMAAGHDVFIIDNLCNSKASVIDRVERITGRRPDFAQTDVRDRAALRAHFSRHRPDAVIHFAGLKAVGESVAKPLTYYDTNVTGSIALAECMLEAGVKTIVFSSSATVYGEPESVRVPRGFSGGAGQSIWTLETDGGRHVARHGQLGFRCARCVAALLQSGRVRTRRGWIGEDPNGIPNKSDAVYRAGRDGQVLKKSCR